MEPEDEAIEDAVTAVNLLDTVAHLCARSCQLAATTGDREEWVDHIEYTAFCLSCVSQTRELARDFMQAAGRIARRRIGADVELSADEFVHALTLTGEYTQRVLARMPVATSA